MVYESKHGLLFFRYFFAHIRLIFMMRYGDKLCLHFHITVRVLSVYCGDFKFTISKDCEDFEALPRG